MDSTERADLSDVVRAAARGELPEWTQASVERREHMGRVAGLMSAWSEAMGLGPRDRIRWAAAGWLHDSLKEADEEELRALVPRELADLSGPLLHGPAAAERLRHEADAEMLDAIRYHTIGEPRLGTLGRALYLADFLEPGRKARAEWRAELRERMPGEMAVVLPMVVEARVRHMAGKGQPIRAETEAFRISLGTAE